MQIPSEWEESYPEERSFRVAILQEPLSALDVRAPICVSPDTKAVDAIRLMNEQRIGALLVTADNDRLVGIFTERDVLKKLVGATVSLERPVRELMTAQPCCLHRDDAVVFALKLMHEGGFRHVPLVDDDGHPYAVISVKDVVEFMMRLFAREMMTAPPASSHLMPATPEGA
jgi:CBS domain-containing protein